MSSTEILPISMTVMLAELRGYDLEKSMVTYWRPINPKVESYERGMTF